jgi:hypothetical protein
VGVLARPVLAELLAARDRDRGVVHRRERRTAGAVPADRRDRRRDHHGGPGAAPRWFPAAGCGGRSARGRLDHPPGRLPGRDPAAAGRPAGAVARDAVHRAQPRPRPRPRTGSTTIERRPFSIDNELDEADVIENEVTLRNIRLWDPNVLETTYQQLQALRPFYQFNTVSVDRYEIDGEMRQVMISTRELSQLQEGTDTWQNRHITFTHGYGVVASQVNTANQEGQPVFLSSNIPPAGEDRVVPDQQPGIYFGEFNQPIYSLVRTAEPPSSTSRTPTPRSRSSPSTTVRVGWPSAASCAASPTPCGSRTTTSC